MVVDILADARKFREGMKEAASDVNKFDKDIQTMKKAGIKVDKDVMKISKDLKKINKVFAKESIAHEDALLQKMQKKQTILAKMVKLNKQNTKEFKEEKKAQTELLRTYTQLRKERAEATGEGQPDKISKLAGWGKKALLGAGAAILYGGIQRVTGANDAYANFAKGGIDIAGSNIRNMAQARAFASGGAGMGYSPEETMQQMAQMARATGYASDVETMQKFARAGMIDTGQATGMMGLQARGGTKNPDAAKRDLEKIMTDAFSTGLEQGRFGEFLTGVTQLAEVAQSRTAGVSSATGAARALALLGSTKAPGLTGARGANVLSQLDQGMRTGGGPAGQAFMMRAYGWGSGADYHDVRKRMDEGFTGERGAENLIAMIKQLQKEFSGVVSSEALSEMTGLSRSVTEAVIEAVNKGGGASKVKREIETLTKKEITLEERMTKVLEGDLSQQAIRQSNIQMMLVDQGSEVNDSIIRMQDLINEAVTNIWPAIAGTLDVIATGVVDAVNFWKSVGKGESGELQALVDSSKTAVGAKKEAIQTLLAEKVSSLKAEQKTANSILAGSTSAETSLMATKRLAEVDKLLGIVGTSHLSGPQGRTSTLKTEEQHAAARAQVNEDRRNKAYNPTYQAPPATTPTVVTIGNTEAVADAIGAATKPKNGAPDPSREVNTSGNGR